MTFRQQLRLELAERVCRLVMRHKTCGLVEAEGYRPDVVVAMHVMQREGERIGNLREGALHWLGEHGNNIQRAVFAWMEAVGIDPKSRDKAEAKLMAMEMARELGYEYEAEIEQTEKAKRRWVERTADERAAAIAHEFFSGKIKGAEELRIAIAADILEAEHTARDPFVEYALAIFHTAEEAKVSGNFAEGNVVEATKALLSAAWRWMGVEPKPDQPEIAAAVETIEPEVSRG